MYKLTIEGLHKSYGDHEVLKGVSLKAKTGDVISLIGASGSGKSTFLRCINFLEQPNDGAMSLDGQNIRMIKDRHGMHVACLLYTSPSPRDGLLSRMPSSA